MNKLFLLFMWFSSTAIYSQMGINTSNPQATLDIQSKNVSGATKNIDGLLIPRVDRERALNMSQVQHSTLIYVNDVTTGAAAGQASNIDSAGFYYFDETSGKWEKFGKPVVSDLKIPSNVLYARRIGTSLKSGSNVVSPVWFEATDHISNEYVTRVDNGTFAVKKTGLYTFDVWVKFSGIPVGGVSITGSVPNYVSKLGEFAAADRGVALRLTAGSLIIESQGFRWQYGGGDSFMTTTVKLAAGEVFKLDTTTSKSGTYTQLPGAHMSVMYTAIP
ncbi:hypothetical protein DRF60_05875 [Chryseobacterium elymi]|uniref:C1q domain-containing protein n=1 Tax=Chryseobacterium elymi TaxID=395936 RepID=A0A3D9DN07_9FLAO|nr:hypothetical protein [Chryseobacterium elymi]REC79353.1 hypothetical protein DRF60_05875 [Chryseobacterium elymi]